MGGLDRVSPAELLDRLGTDGWPRIVDVRRDSAFSQAMDVIVTAAWHDHRRALDWGRDLGREREVVAYCAHGQQVSRTAVALLRSIGVQARFLEGGIGGWRAAGGATVSREAILRIRARGPSLWITSACSPDHLACCWLVRRYLDPEARVLIQPAEDVDAIGAEVQAITIGPADGPFPSAFEGLVRQYQIADPVLSRIGTVVVSAAGRPNDVAEAAGLAALSSGIVRLARGDGEALLNRSLALFDALSAGFRGMVTSTPSAEPVP